MKEKTDFFFNGSQNIFGGEVEKISFIKFLMPQVLPVLFIYVLKLSYVTKQCQLLKTHSGTIA